MDLARRGLLQKGALGGVLLLAGALLRFRFGGRASRPPAPRQPLRLFSPAEYATFAALAERLVPGESADPARWPSAATVECAGKADAVLATCHPGIGRDFVRLLGLFESGAFGLVVHGSPTQFSRLAAAARTERLEAWRTSRLALLRTGYLALTRLVHATYYSSPEVYAAIGYPGPPTVPQP